MLGVSGRTVSYWESWRKLPNPCKEDILREVLGLSEDELRRAMHRPTQNAIRLNRGEKPW
jgi:DNA-binding transcriptional regulator YiaG